MSRLPRQDVPVGLQRYQPGHLPKRRERTVVGRSNRLAHLAETHRAMELNFVPRTGGDEDGAKSHKGARQMTVSQGFVLSGYRSFEEQRDDTQATRTLISTLRTGQTPSNPAAADTRNAADHATRRGIQPPTSAPPTPPNAPLQMEKAWLEVEMHPTVASLLCNNRYGTGHTLTPENFFVRSGGQDADYYTGAPSSGQARRPSARFDSFQPVPFTRNRHVPVRAEAGGMLEYADPVTDEYARNPTVARFDNRQLRAAAAEAATREAALTPSEVAIDGPTSAVRAQETTTTTVATSSVAPNTARRSVSTSWTSPFSGACPPLSPAALPAQDAWLASYVPSARPYDVTPFRGRCGYSDVRLTYHRVQSQPESGMYATMQDAKSTYTVPLDTPNRWRLSDAQQAKRATLYDAKTQ